MIDTMESRYEGGSLRQPSLKIRSVTRTDIGTYSCVLENDLGSGTSDTSAYLDVFYPPVVSIRMSPVMPISELDRTNVTLYCDTSEGNPPSLTSVLWFMDGDLLKAWVNILPQRFLKRTFGKIFSVFYNFESFLKPKIRNFYGIFSIFRQFSPRTI